MQITFPDNELKSDMSYNDKESTTLGSSASNKDEYFTLPQAINEPGRSLNKTPPMQLEPIPETLYQNPLDDLTPRKLAKSYAFCYIKGRPLFTIGPDYSFPLSLIGTMTGIYFIEAITLFRSNYPYMPLIESLAFFIALLSYGATALLNPGIPSPKYYKRVMNIQFPNTNYQTCGRCNITIETKYKVTHCGDCDICVMNYDHHCPWIGKCVGRYNLIPFFFFIFTIMIFFIVSFFTFFLFVVQMDANRKK